MPRRLVARSPDVKPARELDEAIDLLKKGMKLGGKKWKQIVVADDWPLKSHVRKFHV